MGGRRQAGFGPWGPQGPEKQDGRRERGFGEERGTGVCVGQALLDPPPLPMSSQPGEAIINPVL